MDKNNSCSWSSYICWTINADGQFTLETNGENTFSKVRISPAQLKKDSGNISIDQLLHISVVTTDGNLRNGYSSFYIDNKAPEIKIQSPILLSDYNYDGFVDEKDSCSTNLGVEIQHTDCHAECDTISDAAERAYALQNCEKANQNMQPVVHETECDGIDNDFDGYIDANDKSEFKNIRFYSPDFDYKDSLITEAVSIDFEINDNIQQYVKDPNLLQWRIYKVGGNDLDTTTDRLVFRKEITGKEAKFPVKVNDCWRFEPYNRHISPPDGLYAMVIVCKDQAENSVMSIPAYFIIDKQEPTLTVIRDWQDEIGRKKNVRSRICSALFYTFSHCFCN